MQPDNILIIFAKAPVPGLAKTRLFPHISFDEAAGLQKAFIADAIDKAIGMCRFAVQVFYTPPGSLSLFRECFGEGLDYRAQEGEDLGERMSRSFERAFAGGAAKAVLLGTDVPLLPPHFLCGAFHKLESADVVLGPAKDGGYYLVGLKKHIPELFNEMSWSGPEVLSFTLARARYLGLEVELLPMLRDVDTFEDLREVSDHPLPPRTRDVISALAPRLRAQPDWVD